MSDTVMIVRAGVMVPAHDLPAITDGAVAVRGDRIVETGRFDDLEAKYPAAKVIGGDDFLLIPGLVNGHSHGRGLTDFQRGALDNTLETWLLDTRKYIPIEPYDDCALSAARLLKSGVTTTMHNHVLKDMVNYDQEFDQAIQAYRDAGLRLQFNPSVRNANPFVYGDNAAFLDRLPPQMKAALTQAPPAGALDGDHFVEATKRLHTRADNPMCKVGFGPLAPQWSTDQLMKDVRRAADDLNVPIHVHAVQSIYQKVYGLKYLGKSLVAHMHDIGFLGQGLVIGHCTWPTEKDIDLMAETGTSVTHHPSCNLRVRNGIAPAWHMLQAGVNVGLGLDGKSINDDDDFIQEMKVCYLLHRLPSLKPASDHMTARQVFKMATENSAKLLGFGDDVGRLEPGRRADLVLLDYQKMCWPYTDPHQDPIDVLLYRGAGQYVDTVMVDGRVVLENGQVATVDLNAIGDRLAQTASRPKTEAELNLAAAMDEIKKHVIDYYQDWPDEVDVNPYWRINSRDDGLITPPTR